VAVVMVAIQQEFTNLHKNMDCLMNPVNNILPRTHHNFHVVQDKYAKHAIRLLQ